jgi:hypothetical protein
MNFGIVRDHGHTTSFIWIIILFDAVFKYDDGANFLGYVGINAEQLCVEFCNFVQCHIFVNYLTFFINELNIIIMLLYFMQRK